MTDDNLPQELLDKLRAATSWSDETLETHLRNWRTERRDLLASIAGERLTFDELGDLVFQRFPDGDELDRLGLVDEVKTARVGPRSVTLLGTDSKLRSRLSLPADCRPGLILTKDRMLLHADALETQPELALTDTWVDMAPQDFRTQHVDYHFHRETGLLFVCCREAGEIVVISPTDHGEVCRWKLRRPGGWHALNVAFDIDGERAYFTDNVSAQLWIADLETFEIKVWKSGLGVLGNLAPGLEAGKVFLSVLMPQFSLLYFDLASMQASYSVEIKGKSWAQAKILPCDPLSLNPDGRRLHFMTWSEIEGQRTPVVNVINTEEVISLRRFTLKESQTTVQLAMGIDNPFLAWRALDFQTWLLKHRLIRAEQLDAPAVAVAAPKPRPAPRGNFKIYQPPPDDKDLWNKIGTPADPLELPVSAEEAIVDLLNWAFYRMTLTNLRIHPDEMRRLQALAKTLRAELKDKEVVLAKLDQVMGKHAFETPISRSAVLSLLNQAKLGEGMVRLEDTCPICQQAFDHQPCAHCGFRLAWPEGEGYGTVSAEPGSALYPGQLLLPHRKLNQLLTINIWRQPLQQVDLAPAGIQLLGDATVLPNQNFLVADSKGNKVVEISSSGETLWKAKLALKQPVRVSWYQTEKELRYLIVDQGNARVLELDASGRNWRRFPGMKTPDTDKLKAPRDLHLTPNGNWLIADAESVIEVDPRSQVVQRWGAAEGVTRPLLARRMPEGSTEILDAASGRWLEFNADGTPGRSMVYWPPGAERWKQAAPPDWACMLHNGEYLLLGETYMMLLGPRHESLRWIHDLPDPKREDALLKVGFRSKSEQDVRKQQQSEMVEQLKTVIGCLEGEKEEHLEYLARFLKPVTGDVGAWLLQPGSPGSHMYFVLSGSLDVIAPEAEKPLIYFADTGDVCGQFNMFLQEDKGYYPGIRVKEPCKLLMLDRADFKKAVVGFPRLYQMIRTQENELSRRFRLFAERKTEAAQDKLRHNINETRIREFGLFADANDAFFDQLADKVQPLAYMPEQDVFGRLESAGSLYLIMQGSVGVLRKGESEPMIVLGEGDIFGEMALYFQAPRSATIRTLDYCKFFELEYRHVRTLSARFPWFGERLEELARQRRQGNEIAQAAFEEAAGIQREDLPRLEVAPAGQRLGQKLFYQASPRADMLIGFNTLGEVLWCYGREAERQLYHPSRVHLNGDSLLVIDAGNDRVLQIDLASREILRTWSGGLNQPRAAALTPEGLLLVADEGNQRLVVMDESGREVWTHGVPEEILNPTWVEFTPEGHILFADAGMHRVYELQRDGVMVWKHGKWRNPGLTPEQLNGPTCVRRLVDGGTLIADSGNQRLVWIRPEAEPVMIPLEELNLSIDTCDMLENGEFLVVSLQQEQLVRVNRRGELIWRGQLHFPLVAAAPEPEVTTAPAERWILDLDRLDELEIPAAAETESEAAVAAEPAADAAELVLSWGDAQGDEAPPDDAPEATDSALTLELDVALGELHDEILSETPSAPPMPISDADWSELIFQDGGDFGQTLHMSRPPDLGPVESQTRPESGPVFDDEYELVFGATDAAGPPDELTSALEELFDDEPGETGPVPPPVQSEPTETEDIAAALDQLFDEPESVFAPNWSDLAPTTPNPWPGTQYSHLPGPPTRAVPGESHPTRMQASQQQDTQHYHHASQPTHMYASEQHPTRALPAEGHPTRALGSQPQSTQAMPSTPWDEIEKMMDAGPPSTAPASHWKDDDFAWLDEMQDGFAEKPADESHEPD